MSIAEPAAASRTLTEQTAGPVKRLWLWSMGLRTGRWDAPRVAVLLAAAAAAVVAVVLSRTVFTHLSVNDDESVYLLQARALAHGHLFPPAPHPPDAFTPWLGVVHGDHYVVKYLPTLPVMIAASLFVTGGFDTFLACSAAALVIATFALGKQVVASRRTAAIAAVLMAASPVVIVQGGLALPYVPFLVLMELTWWGLLTGARRHSLPNFALAGLCAGLGFTIRSYDAMLLLLPTVAWLALRRPGCRRPLLTGLLGGALPPAVGLLWYNHLATGSALKLPFSVFSPQDTLGFGVHRLYPGEAPRDFGPAQGVHGLLRHFSLLAGGWAIGGIVLAALVVLGAVRGRPTPACLSIACGGGFLTVGYLFFWGTWNASILWGGTRYLGPYYFMPLLVPATFLGAAGLEIAVAASRFRLGVVTVAAAAISGVTLANALTANAAFNADNGRLATTLAAQGKALVFVQTYPDYLQHPTAVISNTSPVGGRTVFALDSGNRNLEVLRSFPGRRLYRLRLLGEYGHTPHKAFGARLEQLRIVTGRTIAFDLSARVPRSAIGAELFVSVARRHHVLALAPDRVNRVRLVLTTGVAGPGSAGSMVVADVPAMTIAGVPAMTVAGVPAMTIAGVPATTGPATVSVRLRTRAGKLRTLDQLRIPLTSTSFELTALTPDRLVAELGPDPAPPLTLSLAE